MTQEYTHRFTEVHEPGGTLYPVSRGAGVFNTGWLDMANHQRIIFLLAIGAMGQGGTVDFYVEQALDAAGATSTQLFRQAIFIAITQLTQAGGDGNDLIAVEVRTEQMDSDWRYLRGVLTVGVSATLCSVIPLRGASAYPPVPVVGWTEIVVE